MRAATAEEVRKYQAWHKPPITLDDFNEADHPRGNSKNAGQFAKTAGGSSEAKPPKSLAVSIKRGNEKNTEQKEEKSTAKVATKQKQIAGTVTLTGFLHKLGSMQKMPGGMESPANFILKNGHPYVANAKTFEGKRDPMHECYRNATLQALNNKDRTYVEGYVSVHGVPIEHAWTVDKEGQIYDSTINPDLGISGYFGIPFKRDYVLAAGLLNKKYGLLGYESRKTMEPLLKGKTEGFKANQDPATLSSQSVADQLSYADKVARSIPPTDKIDTPERKELRAKIANDLYNKDIDKRKRNREATIILGLPGSGKSIFAEPLLKDGALEIDPDLVKQQLPEFQGGLGAFATHEESSAVTRDIRNQAVTNGDNFVWPRIDSPDKVVKDIKALRDAGYKVNVKFLDSSYQNAVKGAVQRYLTKGRYVSLSTIKSYGDSPRLAYDTVKKSGLANETESYKDPKGGFNYEKVKE